MTKFEDENFTFQEFSLIMFDNGKLISFIIFHDFLPFTFQDLAAINEMMRREVQPKSKVGKRLLADDQDTLNDPNAEQTSEPPAKMQLIMPGAMNARLSLVMTDRGQSD